MTGGDGEAEVEAAAEIEVEILCEDARWEAHGLDDDDLADHLDRAVRAALAGIEAPVSVNVLLTDDAAQHVLNREHRGVDRPTDVLSFPADGTAAGLMPSGAPKPLGDLSLAYETVTRDAKAEGVTLPAHAMHLVVHGVLHLLGAVHDDAAQAAAMEAAETRILARLGVADPYA